METTLVKIEDIQRLAEIQIRTKVSRQTVDQYVESMESGVKFDPADAFTDMIEVEGVKTQRIVLADGWHRVLAFEERGIAKIEVNLHEAESGDAIVEAIEFSCERNGKHGLPLSRADKRNAVVTILQNATLKRRGDRPIAKLVGVSPQLVKDVRYELANVDNTSDVSAHKRKPKRKMPEASADPVGDDNDERVKTFQVWVDSGFIEWPDVVKAFESASHVPVLIPKTPHKVILVKDGKRVNMTASKVSVARKDGVQVIVVEVESTKAAKA